MNVPITLNMDYMEAQYQKWKAEPSSVSKDWQLFFEGFQLGFSSEIEEGICDRRQLLKQSHVEEAIYRHRDLGHLLACLDPLASCSVEHPLLNLQAFHLTEEDLDRKFYTPHLLGADQATLRQILQMLRETYCRSIGVEYMHMQDPAERRWLQERMEPIRNRPNLAGDQKIRILHRLCQAALFEHFLNAKYLGQKRFSIKGAEVVIAMLDVLIRHLAPQGGQEIILGMAHRGRLNTQVNILEKPYQAVFCEFENSFNPEAVVGSGDVKYHRGYMADLKMVGEQRLRILLATNPSHLESVDPVVEGIARSRQEQAGNDRRLVLPLLIHGDAAFSAQGIVFETLNLSQLEGYRTGGTLHLVINNQIGFTTLPEDARSTRYSTDVAKMLMVPIFHVHGEDPEAAAHVMQLACDYRQQFGKDVVIDVVCYRRYGHNEGDEPYYTQPQMYDRIKERPPVHQLYLEKLLEEGTISEDQGKRIQSDITECLEKGYQAAHAKPCPAPSVRFFENWNRFHGSYSHDPMETGVPANVLTSMARKLNQFPKGFSVHRKLERILKKRQESVEGGEGIDWANAEVLSFGSLLLEGTRVRLSGQDSRRGTFSQRHSVLVDVNTGEHWTPVNALEKGQAIFAAYDSSLSENAVLGFEYGYSLADPACLTLWEAQFGDFANNAQVVIDQYIAGAESKWQRMSGLVLLLPHGYEGQGPEHSSARLERFLQLCAHENIEVTYPSTPAQYFHLLRRQMKRDFRKPLIVLTPKSLLRHPRAVSRLSELTSGHFQSVLDDPTGIGSPRRLLLCSGKIYYDLVERRDELKANDIAILRLERFYPFPAEQIEQVISQYSDTDEYVWVQEEPENMGGWSFVRDRISELSGKAFLYLGRPSAASPATGLLRIHQKEQTEILDRAFSRDFSPGHRPESK